MESAIHALSIILYKEYSIKVTNITLFTIWKQGILV